MSRIPCTPGIYALLIAVVTELDAVVGALGRVSLSPGCYAYIGSAHGPGGLAARIGRHLSAEKRVRWHIDYILASPAARVVAVIHAEYGGPECVLTPRLEALGFAHPVRGLGSSDCGRGCMSHFLRCPSPSCHICLGKVLEAFRRAGLEPHALLVDPEA